MAYGIENGPGDVRYELNFTHPDLGPGGSTIYFFISHALDSDSTEAERDTIVQRLVDLIDSSPDFSFMSGTKMYTLNRNVTPTI